jgi:Uma2 family endonuclease
MSVDALLSVEEYLRTSYCPDKEFRNGALVERNVGDKVHARLQALLAAYLSRRRKQWQIQAYTELRIQVRENWYPLPDVCVYALPEPEGRYPSQPPLLWIEILSQDDKMIEVWEKARSLTENGVPYVWIVDPNTLESELRTLEAVIAIRDKTLRIPGTAIVIPLQEVVDE